MAERQPLQVVAQIEAGTPNDSDRAEAGIVSALANDVGNPLIAPEENDLVNEVSEEFVEIRIRTRTGRYLAAAITKHAAINSEAVLHCVAQHFPSIELVERVSAGAT